MAALLLFMLLLVCAASALLLTSWLNNRRTLEHISQEYARHLATCEPQLSTLSADLTRAKKLIGRLAKWSNCVDAEDKARELLALGKAAVEKANLQAVEIVSKASHEGMAILSEAQRKAAEANEAAQARANEIHERAQTALNAANDRASMIIRDANKRAEEIAGDAYQVVRDAAMYERTARAMKNIIEGYGDEYIMPAESFLDELAQQYAHKDAGQALRDARSTTNKLIKDGLAADCDYTETNRRQGAIDFVLDAFNGKVDSILSKVRHDNAGKLLQAINDAFVLVNYSGKPFRNARITEAYLASRLNELKWASVAQELRRQEQEEQRRIREQIREEEKARREYERAIRESAKEETTLKKALEKAQQQIEAATEEQKAKYEAQLAELTERLREAELRNQRALSMAQQTKRGHVYIISNIGSFGEHVYKIGLTRRLDPLDRIHELGDSSVPFEFDVHALIFSEDAPALERQLHKHFLINQVNKVNHRKEFFRATLAEIRQEIEKLQIPATWTMAADAMEYRETLAIERAIASDPAAREAWLNRQLTLDPIDYKDEADMIDADSVHRAA